MNKPNVSIEFTTNELEIIQSVLYFIQAFNLGCSSLFKRDGDAITRLESKITAFIGDPYTMIKRANVEADIRKFLADDPDGMSSSLDQLDKLYPLPEALRL